MVNKRGNLMEKENRSIGAFWETRSQAGKKYFKGNIEIEGKTISVTMFENTYKTKDNQPDYKIYKNENYKKKGLENFKNEEDLNKEW